MTMHTEHTHTASFRDAWLRGSDTLAPDTSDPGPDLLQIIPCTPSFIPGWQLLWLIQNGSSLPGSSVHSPTSTSPQKQAVLM